MTDTLRNIVKETMRLMNEADPPGQSDDDWPDPAEKQFGRKRASKMGRYSGYISRKIEPDGSLGELFKVVSTAKKSGFMVPGFHPSDPEEPAEYVVLQSLEEPGKELKVDYDDYVDPEKWARGPGSISSTYSSEPSGKEMTVGDVAKQVGPVHARGPVDVHPRTGKWTQAPGPQLMGKRSAQQTKIDIEKGIDKLLMASHVSPLWDKMVKRALDEYKKELKVSMVVARQALKDWKIRALKGEELAGEDKLSDEEKEWLKDDPARVDAALWELPTFHKEFLPELRIDPKHVSTISSLASRNGSLALTQLKDDADADDIIKEDPGFRMYLEVSGWWDRLRNAAEYGVHKGTKKPLRAYRGQF